MDSLCEATFAVSTLILCALFFTGVTTFGVSLTCCSWVGCFFSLIFLACFGVPEQIRGVFITVLETNAKTTATTTTTEH